MMKTLKRVVITGGPCAGKTTAIDRVKAHFENAGVLVVVVDEVPTEIMRMGITLRDFGKLPFQRAIIDLQQKKEQVMMDAVKAVADKREALVIFDRGILDHFIYLDLDEQKEIEKLLGLQRQLLYQNYDSVIHMLSVAAGIPQFYENTRYRLETLSEARQLDEKIGEIWQQHSDYIRISCENNFENKIAKLIEAIEKRFE